MLYETLVCCTGVISIHSWLLIFKGGVEGGGGLATQTSQLVFDLKRPA